MFGERKANSLELSRAAGLLAMRGRAPRNLQCHPRLDLLLMHRPAAPLRPRMPRHTDHLRADHALVRRALAALAAIGQYSVVGGNLPAEDTAELLQFLREFLLTVHFRKESDHVWPALVMRGDDFCAGKVGDLLRLQTEVTDLVHALMLLWEPLGDLSAAEREAFHGTIEELTSRVLHMQEIEERWLLPATDAAVPHDDQIDWSAAFQSLDQRHDDWVASVERLSSRWLD